MANEISVTREGDKLMVQSPYNPDFPGDARNLGGKWSKTAKVWTFDARDEERVRSLVRAHYGTDGSEPVTLVSLRVKADALSWGEAELWVAGRQIARRIGRDESVRLGDGCVIIEGGFPGSGGSRKSPRLAAEDGTIIEIRDVPAALAASEVEDASVWIVSDDEHTARKNELKTRKAKLLAELAEVEAELKALNSAKPAKPPTALDRIASEDTL